MKLRGLVFGHRSIDLPTTIFFVVKGKTRTGNVQVIPLPFKIRSTGIETKDCVPDWDTVESALLEKTNLVAKLGWEDEVPFLEMNGRILVLYSETSEPDFYNF